MYSRKDWPEEIRALDRSLINFDGQVGWDRKDLREKFKHGKGKCEDEADKADARAAPMNPSLS